MAELTCLRSLTLSGAHLETFPAPVMQLSNLEVLMLDSITPVLELPEALLEFAAWPALTMLSMKPDRDEQYSLRSKVRLQQLRAALRDKSILLS